MLCKYHLYYDTNFAKKFVSSLLLFSILLITAQSTNKYHFSTENGLPSNETYSIYEDSDSFIWIATDKGVSKYNGYDFINYTTENGLGGNTIFNFYEDYKGRLWFLSFNGKLSYYLNGKINLVTYNISYNDIGHILSLYVDTNNTLWIGSTQGEFKASFINKTNLKVTPTKEQYSFRQIDDKGYIFSGNYYLNNNIINYKVKLINTTYLLNYSENSIILPSKNINNLKRKNGIGINWLIHNNVIYNSNSYQALIFNLKSKKTKSIKFKFKDRPTGTRIMKFKNQYVFYNLSQNKLYAITKFPPYIKAIKSSNNFLTSIITDNQEGTWTSTHDKGVFYEPKTIIKNISSNKFENEAIVSMISNDSSFFLRSKNSKIFKFTNNLTLKKIKNSPLGRLNGKLYNFRDTIVYNDIIDKQIKTINHKPFFNEISKKPPFISSFNNNEFTLYSWSNVHMYTKNKQLLFSFNFSKDKVAIKSICYKNSNTIYIASRQGLFEMNDIGNIIFMGDQNPIFKTRIDQINRDKNGRFWMITKEKGVIIIDNDQVINITTNNGLLGNICTGLFIGKKRVWIATEKGLSGINLNDYNDIDNFTQKDGLISNQINDIYEYNNKVWIASDKGLSYLDVNYSKKTYSPKIYIEKISIDNNDLIDNKHITIPPTNNLLKINFLGLSYREHGDLQYKYRLKGLDSTWYTTKNRSVQYSTLPTGNYTFEIKAVNHQGIFSKETKSVKITKQPYFWETLYFIIPFIIISFFLINILIYVRIRRVKKRAYLKQRIISTELKLLRSQMNPHFTFNAMSSIQYYIQNNNTKKALHYVHRFSTLIRLILEHTQKDTIFLEQELEALKLYVTIEQERLKNSFSFIVNIDDDIDVKTTQIAPMLLQPYVENAIWHGIMHKNSSNGVISLNIYLENNRLICEIIDNGVGRLASTMLKQVDKESFGMNLLEERLYLINNTKTIKQTVKITDLLNENQNSCGTKVKLTL